MKPTKLFLLITFISGSIFYACKKETPEQDPKPVDKCASKTLGVTAEITAANNCLPDGKMKVLATGSSGFTYSLNSGSFQADSNFTQLAAGNYTVTVKDADGCTKSASITVWGINGPKGPLYNAVSQVIATKCNGGFCHGTGSGAAPTQALNSDCKIIALKDLINTKVLGSENMGNLNATDKKKISDWLAAGGTYNN